MKVIGNPIQGYQEAISKGSPGGIDMGPERAIQIALRAAGFHLGRLIKLDLGHFHAGEAQCARMIQRAGQSGGVDGRNVQTKLCQKWFEGGSPTIRAGARHGLLEMDWLPGGELR